MKTLLGKYYDALKKAKADEKLSCHVDAIKNKIDLLEEGSYEVTTLDMVWVDYFLGIKSQLLELCRKVGFVYHMVKGKETCESYIELPVSAERFAELYFYISDTKSRCYDEVWSALSEIAMLQGYRLTNFIPEFKVDGAKHKPSKVYCNNCMEVFPESEVAWDCDEDMEFCPKCGEGRTIRDFHKGFTLGREQLERLRGYYVEGRRVELVEMEDPYSKLKPGDKGTIDHVDDAGGIHIKWDCGSSLAAIWGEDIIKII